MNQKGFLLAEETLKIIIAVIAIGFLAYFLVSLYLSSTTSAELSQAKSTLPSITDAIKNGENSIDVYNPKGWAIISWPFDGNKPKVCSDMNWESCICICDIPTAATSGNYLDNCNDPSKGICAQNTGNFVVQCSSGVQCPVTISNPPITLNLDKNAKIITEK